MAKSAQDSISYSYVFDVIAKKDYKKYANKERRKKVNMVGIKLINESRKPITINADHFSVSSAGKPVKLYTPAEFYKIIHQKNGYYLLYFISSPIIVGLPIGLGNFFVAADANKELNIDLEQNQLIGKTVPAKCTIFAYVYMQQPPDSAITISLK